MIIHGTIPSDNGGEFQLSFNLEPMARALDIDIKILAECFKMMDLTIITIKKDGK